MPLRAATVIFKGQPAGLMTELAGGAMRFTYNPGWPTSIACALPVAQQEFTWRAGLHPFFQHLGPEGWLREKQARAGRVDQEDDLGLLLRYGEDCIGAVGIRPIDGDLVPNPIATDFETEAATSGHRTVSGVQRKLLAYKADTGYRPSDAASPATHIAKFNSPTNDSLIRNEFTTLRLAQQLLGAQEVTTFETATVLELDEPALIIKRFDRTPAGEKLRLEDFAQVLSQPRGNDFRGKYEANYEDIAEAIKTFSALPVVDLNRFFKRLIVNFLVGNADAHLKNFSLLETPTGMRLSPAYDMLNTLWYGARYDSQAALGINGRKPPLTEISRTDMVTFGLAIGLKQKAIDKGLHDLKQGLQKSTVLKRPSGSAPSEFLDTYIEIVDNAALRIFT